MNRTSALKASHELVVWLARQVGGISIPSTLRVRCAAVCFGVAEDHHASITALLSLPQPIESSCFTLARPQFENYVRGMWLATAASEKQIDDFAANKPPPDIKSMIRITQKAGELEDSLIGDIHAKSWDSMCGLTHGGAQHIARWSDGQHLEPAYGEEDVLRLIDFASRFAVLSVAGIAWLSRQDGLFTHVLTEGKARIPVSPHVPKEE